jgi:hypothetical protein
MSRDDFASRFQITSPCTEDWDSMVGNDQIRFCTHCQRSVHDFSTMSRKQIKRIVAASGGRFCVRYSAVNPRPIVTPARVLYRIGKRTSKIAAGAFSATLSLSSAVGANGVPKYISRPDVVSQANYLRETFISAGSASIHGTIFDPNGAAIPGAVITLTNVDSRQIVSTVSDGSGTYTINIETGTYNLKVEAPGFAQNTISTLVLRDNDNNRIDQTLGIATISETVEVTSEASTSQLMGGAVLAMPTDPLVKAAFADDLNTVREELTRHDANTRDKTTEWTALECAVRNANREMVQVLLWAKADVNSRDASGQSVLMMLGEDVTTDIVWDLLNAGAKVNARDNDGDTPLSELARINNTEVLKTLLDVGAKVNTVNDEGLSPLMVAASEGHINNIRLLIQAGAEINQRDKEGKTALNYAKEGEHSAAIRLLVSFGAIEFERKVAEKEDN